MYNVFWVSCSISLALLIFAPPSLGPNCWRDEQLDVKSLLRPPRHMKKKKKREKSETVLISSPIHHPTSERSKPTLVITAGQKGSLLIISPLYVLLAQILDVSLCWGAGVGWFGATHYAHFTICSNAQKMCSPEWVSLLKTCHPSGRKKAASLWGGRRRGGGGRRHSQPHTQPGPWRRLRE